MLKDARSGALQRVAVSVIALIISGCLQPARDGDFDVYFGIYRQDERDLLPTTEISKALAQTVPIGFMLGPVRSRESYTVSVDLYPSAEPSGRISKTTTATPRTGPWFIGGKIKERAPLGEWTAELLIDGQVEVVVKFRLVP